MVKSFTCLNCQETFESKYSDRKFCGKSCSAKYNNSNRIITQEQKEKTKKTLKTKFGKDYYCIFCGKKFPQKRLTGICAKCMSTTEEGKKLLRKSGQAGGRISSGNLNLRGKNEIAFSELCKKKFINILTNKRLFGKFDADVIIEDYKIVVLWNGYYHYRQIYKRCKLEDVQRRDREKIPLIKERGYIPFIVKDLHSANIDFVNQQFVRFLNFIEECIKRKLITVV